MRHFVFVSAVLVGVVFGSAPLLTDVEIAELSQRGGRLFKNPDIDSDFAGGDNFFLALLADPKRHRHAAI